MFFDTPDFRNEEFFIIIFLISFCWQLKSLTTVLLGYKPPIFRLWAFYYFYSEFWLFLALESWNVPPTVWYAELICIVLVYEFDNPKLVLMFALFPLLFWLLFEVELRAVPANLILYLLIASGVSRLWLICLLLED